MLNPLFCEATVRRQLPDADRVPALYAYLVADKSRVDVSPNWDASAGMATRPEAVHDPAGILGVLWRNRDRDRTVRLGRGAMAVDVPWERVREVARWAAAAATAPRIRSLAEPTAAANDAVLAVLDDSDVDYDQAIAALAEVATQVAHVRVAATAASADMRVQTGLMALWTPGVEARFAARSEPREALGALVSGLPGGLRVIGWRAPGAQLSAAGLASLLERGAAAVVAPLWLDCDGTTAGLGVIAHDGRAVRLLAGHPREDAVAAADDSGFVSIPTPLGDSGAGPAGPVADALRALAQSGDIATLVAIRARKEGITAGVLTESVAVAQARVPELPEGSPAPVGAPDADDPRVAAILRRAGFATAPGTTRLVAVRRATTQRVDGQTVPRLRWALRTASPAGPRGESWGDTHFARGLAEALRRLGQDVVIDAFEARHRPTTYLDDVTLVLRGPHRIDPSDHGVSLLWIISHPDEITPEEVAGFDHTFAASRSWAGRASARWGLPIDPLLQCTDATRFRPRGLPRTTDIVFVGTARGIARPSVVGPLRAGVPVRVYGPDWRGYIPASAIADTNIDNAQLPARYETARAVLNDHWPAMQAEGFISNRPYDVIAAGGRVISDHVEGIEAEFLGAVVTYRDVEELVAILTGDLDSFFPDDSTLRDISAMVRTRDSFDARAATLLSAAQIAAG